MLNKLFLTMLVFFAVSFSSFDVHASSDVCEAPAELHKNKMERFMMKDIPSILDDCGLGQLLNFCNNPYLKMIGQAMGLCGGVDVGIGDFSSNFCGIGFKLPDITNIYISQRNELKEQFRHGQGQKVDLKYASSEISVAELVAEESRNKEKVVVASSAEIKTALGI